MRLFCVTLMILASLSTAHAAGKQSSSNFGFSCDVNTQKCECTGVETGADCQAMKKNCSSDPLNCFKDINYKSICICTMASKTGAPRVPSIVGPKPNQIAPRR
jgi:hypothetical protein